jgi:phosphorylcholine metabolism protein LicD
VRLIKKSDLIAEPDEMKMRSDAIDNFLLIFSKIAETNGIVYWMDHSALLGIIRGEDLARFSDVDIALISSNDAEELWRILSESELSQSFDISRTFTKDNEVSSKHMKVGSLRKVLAQSRVSIVNQEPAIIDINIRTKIGDELFYAINAKEAKTPFIYFDGYEIASYNNIKLRIPKKAEEYLELLYGPDWRTPAEFFSDSEFDVITE